MWDLFHKLTKVKSTHTLCVDLMLTLYRRAMGITATAFIYPLLITEGLPQLLPTLIPLTEDSKSVGHATVKFHSKQVRLNNPTANPKKK